jgi:hypothetical protein
MRTLLTLTHTSGERHVAAVRILHLDDGILHPFGLWSLSESSRGEASLASEHLLPDLKHCMVSTFYPLASGEQSLPKSRDFVHDYGDGPFGAAFRSGDNHLFKGVSLAHCAG